MKKIILSFAAILFASCSTNSIYFDLNRKKIISCNGSMISNIIIESTDNVDYYRFSLKQNLSKGVETFSIVNIDPSFDIYKSTGEIISTESFSLKPLSNYKISNSSNGDGAENSLIIATDRNGNVVESTKTNCE